MTIPGFTADASLYGSRGRYMAVNDMSGPYYRALVSPQACGGFKPIVCNGLILGFVACAAFTERARGRGLLFGLSGRVFRLLPRLPGRA
jgi:hypothetical protein